GGENGDDYEGGNRGVNGNENDNGNKGGNGNGNTNRNGNGNEGGNGYKNHNVNFKGDFKKWVLLYTRMVLDEEDKVEKFIGDLPDNIQGNVIAIEPTRLQRYAEPTRL
nr:hypothetical protein [Tanacetum cinerariifolium]